VLEGGSGAWKGGFRGRWELKEPVRLLGDYGAFVGWAYEAQGKRGMCCGALNVGSAQNETW